MKGYSVKKVISLFIVFCFSLTNLNFAPLAEASDSSALTVPSSTLQQPTGVTPTQVQASQAQAQAVVDNRNLVMAAAPSSANITYSPDPLHPGDPTYFIMNIPNVGNVSGRNYVLKHGPGVNIYSEPTEAIDFILDPGANRDLFLSYLFNNTDYFSKFGYIQDSRNVGFGLQTTHIRLLKNNKYFGGTDYHIYFGIPHSYAPVVNGKALYLAEAVEYSRLYYGVTNKNELISYLTKNNLLPENPVINEFDLDVDGSGPRASIKVVSIYGQPKPSAGTKVDNFSRYYDLYIQSTGHTDFYVTPDFAGYVTGSPTQLSSSFLSAFQKAENIPGVTSYTKQEILNLLPAEAKTSISEISGRMNPDNTGVINFYTGLGIYKFETNANAHVIKINGQDPVAIVVPDPVQSLPYVPSPNPEPDPSTVIPGLGVPVVEYFQDNQYSLNFYEYHPYQVYTKTLSILIPFPTMTFAVEGAYVSPLNDRAIVKILDSPTASNPSKKLVEITWPGQYVLIFDPIDNVFINRTEYGYASASNQLIVRKDITRDGNYETRYYDPNGIVVKIESSKPMPQVSFSQFENNVLPVNTASYDAEILANPLRVVTTAGLQFYYKEMKSGQLSSVEYNGYGIYYPGKSSFESLFNRMTTVPENLRAQILSIVKNSYAGERFLGPVGYGLKANVYYGYDGSVFVQLDNMDFGRNYGGSGGNEYIAGFLFDSMGRLMLRTIGGLGAYTSKEVYFESHTYFMDVLTGKVKKIVDTPLFSRGPSGDLEPNYLNNSIFVTYFDDQDRPHIFEFAYTKETDQNKEDVLWAAFSSPYCFIYKEGAKTFAVDELANLFVEESVLGNGHTEIKEYRFNSNKSRKLISVKEYEKNDFYSRLREDWYNAIGFLSERNIYSKYPTISRREVYTYDLGNHRVRISENNLTTTYIVDSEMNIINDAFGQPMIYEIQTSSGGITRYHYDNQNRLDSKSVLESQNGNIVTDSKGNPLVAILYDLDPATGKNVQIFQYFYEGTTLVRKWKYRLDADKNIQVDGNGLSMLYKDWIYDKTTGKAVSLVQKNYNSNTNKLESIYEFVLDANGNIAKDAAGNELVSKRTYFDDAGRTTRIIYNQTGSNNRQLMQDFDPATGVKTKEVSYMFDSSGKAVTYSSGTQLRQSLLEFDAKTGKVVKRTYYKQDSSNKSEVLDMVQYYEAITGNIIKTMRYLFDSTGRAQMINGKQALQEELFYDAAVANQITTQKRYSTSNLTLTVDGKQPLYSVYEYKNGLKSRDLTYSFDAVTKVNYTSVINTYASDGIHGIKTEFFDSTSKLTRSFSTEYFPNTWTVSKSIQFDAATNKQKEIVYNSSNQMMSLTEINKTSNTKKVTEYDGLGHITTIYEYDSSARMVKADYFDMATGLMKRHVDNVYASDGKRNEKMFNVMSDGVTMKLYYEKNYDAAGKILEQMDYNDDGSMKSKTLFNSDGTRNIKTDFLSGGAKNITYYLSNKTNKFEEYDSAGKLLKTTFYKADGVSIDYAKSVITNPDGSRVETFYDSNLKTSHVDEYLSNGKMKKVTSYNSDGTINSIDLYNRVDSTDESHVYTSFYQGKESLKTEWDRTGKKIKITNSFYTNGVLTSKEIQIPNPSNGSMYKSVKQTFNANGLMTQEDRYNLDGSWNGKVTYEYYVSGKMFRVAEYDKYGLMTKETFYNEDGTVKAKPTLSNPISLNIYTDPNGRAYPTAYVTIGTDGTTEVKIHPNTYYGNYDMVTKKVSLSNGDVIQLAEKSAGVYYVSSWMRGTVLSTFDSSERIISSVSPNSSTYYGYGADGYQNRSLSLNKTTTSSGVVQYDATYVFYDWQANKQTEYKAFNAPAALINQIQSISNYPFVVAQSLEKTEQYFKGSEIPSTGHKQWIGNPAQIVTYATDSNGVFRAKSVEIRDIEYATGFKVTYVVVDNRYPNYYRVTFSNAKTGASTSIYTTLNQGTLPPGGINEMQVTLDGARYDIKTSWMISQSPLSMYLISTSSTALSKFASESGGKPNSASGPINPIDPVITPIMVTWSNLRVTPAQTSVQMSAQFTNLPNGSTVKVVLNKMQSGTPSGIIISTQEYTTTVNNGQFWINITGLTAGTYYSYQIGPVSTPTLAPILMNTPMQGTFSTTGQVITNPSNPNIPSPIFGGCEPSN